MVQNFVNFIKNYIRRILWQLDTKKATKGILIILLEVYYDITSQPETQ